MSLYEQMQDAMANKDSAAMARLYHQDYTFVRHQTGQCMPLSEWLPIMKNMVESEAFKVHSNRCLYENDDVLAMHSIISFPDGSHEAVLAVHTIKEGKLIITETGATPVQSL